MSFNIQPFLLRWVNFQCDVHDQAVPQFDPTLGP